MTNIYEEKTVRNLMLTFSIPSIFALIIEILTSVVDTAFAGHISSQSSQALTAMGLISPLLAIFTAMQTLFAISTSIMIAKYMNDKENLNKHFIVGIIMSVAVSLFTSIIIYIFMDHILKLLGADRHILILAKEYLSTQLISSIFSSLGYTLVSSIRALGYPNMEFIIIILAVIINIVCNGILTFGFALGLKGIALGTLISEVVCAFIALKWLIRKKLWVNKLKVNSKEFISITISLFKIGVTQTIIQVLAGCTGFFINGSLLNFGNQNYIAIWNVVQNIYMLMLMPIVGISQGSQTILAYFGSIKNEIKSNETIKISIIYCGIYGLIAALIIIFGGDMILSLFGMSSNIKDIGLKVIKIVFITFPFTGVLYTNMTLLQVTEREIESVVLALTRQVFSIVPLVIILPLIFSKISLGIIPAISIFFAIPIADIISTIIAVILIKRNKSLNI